MINCKIGKSINNYVLILLWIILYKIILLTVQNLNNNNDFLREYQWQPFNSMLCHSVKSKQILSRQCSRYSNQHSNFCNVHVNNKEHVLYNEQLIYHNAGINVYDNQPIKQKKTKKSTPKTISQIRSVLSLNNNNNNNINSNNTLSSDEIFNIIQNGQSIVDNTISAENNANNKSIEELDDIKYRGDFYTNLKNDRLKADEIKRYILDNGMGDIIETKNRLKSSIRIILGRYLDKINNLRKKPNGLKGLIKFQALFRKWKIYKKLNCYNDTDLLSMDPVIGQTN